MIDQIRHVRNQLALFQQNVSALLNEREEFIKRFEQQNQLIQSLQTQLTQKEEEIKKLKEK